jgi:ankyrin repeat protein
MDYNRPRPPFIPRPPTVYQQQQQQVHEPQRNIDTAVVDKLLVIVQNGNINEIQQFIHDNNISMGAYNKTGSVLHRIIQSQDLSEQRRYDLVDFAINNGAPINVPTEQGVTALHLAAQYSLPTVVKLLIKHGANPAAIDSTYRTPLHYLVGSQAVPCKKVKKVKSLVPKPTKRSDKMVQQKQLREAADLIREILKTPNFNKYLQHIRNSIIEAENIWPEQFEGSGEDYRQKLIAIGVDKTRQEAAKQREIQEKTVGFATEAATKIRDKLPTTLGTNTVDVNEQDKNKLKDVDPVLVTQNMKTTINDEFNKKMGKFDNTLTKIENSLQLMEKAVANIIELLTQIIVHNKNIEINHFGVIDARNAYVNWDTLRDLYLYPFQNNYDGAEAFIYPELNMSGTIPRTELLTPSNTQIRDQVRATDAEQKTWEKQKIEPKAAPITVDYDDDNPQNWMRPIIGRDVEDKIANRRSPPIINAFGPILHDNIRRQTLQFIVSDQLDIDDRANIPIYFIGKLHFAIKQSLKHTKIIRDNIIPFISQLSQTINYQYEYYHRFLTNTYYSILNIMQNFVFAKKDKELINTRTAQIRNVFIEKLRTGRNHPYVFSLEYAISMAKSIHSLVEAETFKTMDETYKDLINLIDASNDLIDFMNDYSALNYMRNYFDTLNTAIADPNPVGKFLSNTTAHMVSLYDRVLFPLKKPPGSLEEYYAQYSEYTPTEEGELDTIRKQLYERYAPKITSKNFATYRSNRNPNEPIQNMSIARSDRFNDYIDVRTPASNLNSITGYLINIVGGTGRWKTLANDPIDRRIDMPLPEITPIDTKDIRTGTVALPNPTRIGQFGYKRITAPANKSDPVLPSIGRNLDQHLNMIKFMLIKYVVDFIKNRNAALVNNNQTLINTATNIYTDLTTSITQDNPTPDADKIVDSIISRITDEILINQIITNIQQASYGYVAKVQDPQTNVITQRLLTQVEQLLNPDIGFELDLNKVFDELVAKFKLGPVPLNDPSWETLKYNADLVEEQDPLEEQLTIYGDLSELNCYMINPSIVPLLSSTVNHKDADGRSPLFRAIGIKHASLVKKLLANGSEVSTKKVADKHGQTPLTYTQKLLSSNSTTVTGIINNIIGPLQKEIQEGIEARPENNNNILKYLDLVLPMVLIMYNNIFYYNLKDDLAKQQQLYNLFAKYNIAQDDKILPLLKFDPNIVQNDSTIGVLVRSANELNKTPEVTNLTNKLKEINSLVNQLQSRATTKEALADIEALLTKQNALLDRLQKLHASNRVDKTQQDHLIANILNKKQISAKELDDRRTGFLSSSKRYYVQSDPATIYENIRRSVVQDVRLYDEIWGDLLNNNTRLQHPSNLHLVCLLLQSKIDNPGDLQQLQQLYVDLFGKYINDFNDLPQDYSQTSNYMLYQVVNIIIHVIRYTICNSLYLAVVKAVVEYFLTINPNITEQELVKKTQDTLGTKVEQYIMGDKMLAQKIVKNILKVYEDEADEDRTATCCVEYFEPILIALNRNNPKLEKATLIDNLNNYIFPYFNDVFLRVIPAIKTMLNNYNNMILNDTRSLEIVYLVQNKALTEQ